MIGSKNGNTLKIVLKAVLLNGLQDANKDMLISKSWKGMGDGLLRKEEIDRGSPSCRMLVTLLFCVNTS
jgi:hypothetical protein